MGRVLIVDDEKSFLTSLKSGLEKCLDDPIVFTASNGKEAVTILENEEVDLLITDLRMPEMDGMELLAYISKNYPLLPFIVMTAYGTPLLKEKMSSMGNLKFLDKPIDFQEMTKVIEEGLKPPSDGGFMKGIALASFLQLITMEQQTCLLKVYSKEKNSKGLLYFKDGVLYDAVCKNKQGEQAGIEMIGWENVEITFMPTPKKKIKRRVEDDLMSIILEGIRVLDESSQEDRLAAADQEDYAPTTLENAADLEPELELSGDVLTDYLADQSLDISEQGGDDTEDMRFFKRKKKANEEIAADNPVDGQEDISGLENDASTRGVEDVQNQSMPDQAQIVKGDTKEMSKLQETQDYLMGAIDGFMSCDVVDVESGLTLAGACPDPNLDRSIPAAMFTDTFRSAVKGFDVVNWGIPSEVLIPGKTSVVIMISLADGKYYQGIATSSKTPLGMIRAIFSKIKPEVESALP